MKNPTFYGIKKALTVLLLISLAVSLTAASASAWSPDEKAQATSKKSTCAKPMEEQAKGKVTANNKYVCDCCCITHQNDPHWYCTSDLCDASNRNCIYNPNTGHTGVCTYRSNINFRPTS